MLRITNLALAIAVVGIAAAATAAPQEQAIVVTGQKVPAGYEPVSQTVDIRDLNLATEAGVKEMQKRVGHAGKRIVALSLREQLKDSNVEVIEIIPPGVQTDLMPGQADDPQMMPLEDYIAETMANFEAVPTPAENAVQRVNFLRKAMEEGRFDQTFHMLNSTHR